jgi:hypothetical protein
MPRLARIGAAASGAFGLPNTKPPFITANYLIVGGTGSKGNLNSGGGGGGQVKQSTFSLSTSATYVATVGASTQSSTFNGVTSASGLNGQDRDPADSTSIDGGASGSGNAGGAGARIYLGPYNSPYGAGGGAGQGAVGGGGSAVDSPPYTSGVYSGGNGGVGVVWSVTGVYYGGGQGGGADAGGHGTANGGSNGLGFDAFGSLSGGVIISYVSELQLYTGGTVTSSGSGPTKRWFHTFTSTANLVPKVY